MESLELCLNFPSPSVPIQNKSPNPGIIFSEKSLGFPSLYYLVLFKLSLLSSHTSNTIDSTNFVFLMCFYVSNHFHVLLIRHSNNLSFLVSHTLFLCFLVQQNSEVCTSSSTILSLLHTHTNQASTIHVLHIDNSWVNLE